MLRGGQDPDESVLRPPREYVTPKKQERLRKTAAWYLMVKDLDCPARFDVAEVYTEGPHPQKASRIEYIENAF